MPLITTTLDAQLAAFGVATTPGTALAVIAAVAVVAALETVRAVLRGSRQAAKKPTLSRQAAHGDRQSEAVHMAGAKRAPSVVRDPAPFSRDGDVADERGNELRPRDAPRPDALAHRDNAQPIHRTAGSLAVAPHSKVEDATTGAVSDAGSRRAGEAASTGQGIGADESPVTDLSHAAPREVSPPMPAIAAARTADAKKTIGVNQAPGTGTRAPQRRRPAARRKSVGELIAKAQTETRRGKHDEARKFLHTALKQADKQRASAPLAAAEVRLSLAELEAAVGDLTSACEHWQLARDVFADAGARDRENAVDARMRDLQCPTDWILTEF